MRLSQIPGRSIVTILLLVLSLDLLSVLGVPAGRARKLPRAGRGRRQRLFDGLRGHLEPRAPRQYGRPPEVGFPPPPETPPSTGCPEQFAKSITAPKSNIWQGLTGPETAEVTAWLFQQEDLNLTVTEEAESWDNTVLTIELMQPNKTDSLPYLYGNASIPPPRFARVVVDNRATVDAHYQDILVGPLPISNTTTWQALEYPLTRRTGGKVRNLDADVDALYDEWLYVLGESIADITLDLWGGTAAGYDDDTLEIWGAEPLLQDDGRVKRWDTFWNTPEDDFHAGTLLPLGLFVKSDVTGRDMSKWRVEGWLYDDVFYPTTEELRAAYDAGELRNLGANVEGDWARTDRQGPFLPMDTAAPPQQVAPSGSRFAVDVANSYVEWMGFSFYMSFSRDVGLTLHDIRFQGERVLYELGLQEALAHYAGNDPVQAHTAYLDSFYGFGPYSFQLVRGYDCPSYATYLNTSFYVAETTRTHIDSLCLFEADAGYALQRHATDRYISATKNTQFVVRMVSTIGNYDYTFSYVFSLDGTINVDVRASGYIQSAFYAHNEDYGFRIHEQLSGSMHDHVLNFKADFDVLGEGNTVVLAKVTPQSKTFPWSDGKTVNTMSLVRSSVAQEGDGSRFDWDANAQTSLLVVNTDQSNRWGEHRGYRVYPSTPPQHLTVRDSSALGVAAQWAMRDVHISAQHDAEPRASHAYNSQDVHDPPVNFDQFFDGESLLQQDLVLWLNLGMHHVPHSGDLPNTLATTAHAGLTFTPSNFLDGDPSRQTVNMMRLAYRRGKVRELEEFGQGSGQCAMVYTPVEADLMAYTGDLVVRKFPYDPNNPYYDTESVP